MKALKKETEPSSLPCESVESIEEAQVLVAVLESNLGKYEHLSAPEINLQKKVAIIRTSDFSIDLINPIILSEEDPIISFGETCSSFPHSFANCFRYNKIKLQNGIKKKELILEGISAILVQHEVDHLNSISIKSRLIKMAIVREGGKIIENNLCFCGSKRKFVSCCKKK